MSDDSIKTLVAHGLAAMKAGSDVAAKATDEINGDVQHPQLKAVLEAGNKVSQQWAERIARASQQVGAAGPQENRILEAHYEVSRRIRQQAPDAQAKDLGIVADGQMALHYWIAAFGTMSNYAKQLGMEDVANDMKMSADEAKQGDQKMTEVAEQLLQAA